MSVHVRPAANRRNCEGILAWNIRQGNYGDVRLDGLSVMALGTFKGNIWEGQTKATMALFLDERANERQREALQMIFGGRVGGWPGTFANIIGEVRGMEFAHIDFHVDNDLASWHAEIPGKLSARAEAIGGPTTPPGKRVQVHNAGGCETGPGGVATYGKRSPTKPTPLGSNGTGPGVRANTSASTGRDPTPERSSRMNDLTRQLANHIKRTVAGPMWHGPALNEVLDGVTADIAAARPPTGAHSIWSSSCTSPCGPILPRARVKGERIGDPTPAEDWPTVGDATADRWTSAVERMREKAIDRSPTRSSSSTTRSFQKKSPALITPFRIFFTASSNTVLTTADKSRF